MVHQEVYHTHFCDSSQAFQLGCVRSRLSESLLNPLFCMDNDRVIFSRRVHLPRINSIQFVLHLYCSLHDTSDYLLFTVQILLSQLYFFIYFSPKFISGYSKVLLIL